MNDPTHLAAQAAATAAAIPARRRAPRHPRPKKEPRVITASELVERIAAADGVLASVIYDVITGEFASAVHRNAGPAMNRRRAEGVARLCRCVVVTSEAKVMDLCLDDSIRVVVETVDVNRVLAVFTVEGSKVNKSLRRMMAQARRRLLRPEAT